MLWSSTRDGTKVGSCGRWDTSMCDTGIRNIRKLIDKMQWVCCSPCRTHEAEKPFTRNSQRLLEAACLTKQDKSISASWIHVGWSRNCIAVLAWDEMGVAAMKTASIFFPFGKWRAQICWQLRCTGVINHNRYYWAGTEIPCKVGLAVYWRSRVREAGNRRKQTISKWCKCSCRACVMWSLLLALSDWVISGW